MKRVKRFLRFLREYWTIRLSGLFDKSYYLEKYSDVRSAGMDPIKHYVLHGWKEGRNPAPWFDTKEYLRANPDVAEARINPFYHWIKWGLKEGRGPNPACNEEIALRKSKLRLLVKVLREVRREPQLVKRFFYELKRYGFSRAIRKVRNYLKKKAEEFSHNNYECWIIKNEPSAGELESQRKQRFKYNPKISIVTPVWNTPKKFLIEMLESVLAQTYENWELCIADGGSTQKHVREILERYKKRDERIKVKYLDENRGIVGNSNEALELATGEYIAFLDHDDLLPPFALFEVVKAINENPEVDLIYSDEDKISEDGTRRFDPFFKPDWSPDLLRSYNYITHLLVIKRELLDLIGKFREGFDGSQDYDLILRATERAKKIVHIPKVLYHWRISSSSTSFNPESKLYAFEAGKRALEEHLRRVGLEGKVEILKPYYGWYRITYKLRHHPLISIIIPNKDSRDILERCLSSIIEKSTYRNFEIIIVENNSEQQETFEYYRAIQEEFDFVKVIEWDKPFNWSAVNNFAVNFAKGEVLLFLNNDTEVINPDWLERMLEHLQRSEVGVVGAKLYYPDGTIQHGGVIIGIGGVAGHSHKYFPKDHPGYFGRLISVQNLSAVTGACMMVKRSVFEEVKGFDEGYPLAFNDVDFCLKVREKGYLIVWTPFAELYHHESKTRGYEDTPEKQERFRREIERFKEKWGHVLEKGDPYYNPNLTLEREDFSIKC